jgi:peptide subunit release factor 1 (eRF1)
MILSKDNKRGTEGILFYIQPAGDALDKTSLARSQLTYEKENISSLS